MSFRGLAPRVYYHYTVKQVFARLSYTIIQVRALKRDVSALADLHSKILDARPPPPPGIQILSILSIACSLGEDLAKLCVHAAPPPPGGFTPQPGGILDPPLRCSTE